LTALQKAGLGTPQNGIFSGLINTEKWSVKLILDFFAKPSTIYPKIYQEGKTMMIQNILRLATAALIFISIPAHAEFYQYEDKNGVVHYTDNFATIPEQYRSQISSHPETPPASQEKTRNPGIHSNEPSIASDNESSWQDSKTENSDNQKISKAEEKDSSGKDMETARLKRQRQILLEEKNRMNDKYKKILKEKQKLESSRSEIEEEAEINAYNKKVQQLNEKINEYREKENALKSEIQEYNEMIKGLRAGEKNQE
jgi:hypothetical protein